MLSFRRLPRRITNAALALATLLPAGAAFAATPTTGWGDNPGRFSHWWLAPDYSVHGRAVDGLFVLIFWITMVVFIAVQIAIVYFAIKFRSRKGVKRRALFTHGNTRLEMAWTILPAIILIVLA